MSEVWVEIEAENVLRGDTVRVPGHPKSADEVVAISLGHMKSGGAAYWNDAPWEHINITLAGRKAAGLPTLELEPAFSLEVLADEAFERRRIAAILATFPGTTAVL
jgi:hypothetical protein